MQLSFLGSILHSSEYISSYPSRGRKVAVVGAGCSAHDIAQDLTNKGSRVVLIQRSPTAVVSRETISRMLSGNFSVLALEIFRSFEPQYMLGRTSSRQRSLTASTLLSLYLLYALSSLVIIKKSILIGTLRTKERKKVLVSFLSETSGRICLGMVISFQDPRTASYTVSLFDEVSVFVHQPFFFWFF